MLMGQSARVEWESYRAAAEAVWARHEPRTWALMLTPWPWAGRVAAKSITSHLAAVVADLERLDPPEADAGDLEVHYLAPLRVVSAAVADVAASMPLRVPFADAVRSMEERAPLFPDDVGHDYVVDHGLPQWWLPKTEAWKRQG